MSAISGGISIKNLHKTGLPPGLYKVIQLIQFLPMSRCQFRPSIHYTDIRNYEVARGNYTLLVVRPFSWSSLKNSSFEWACSLNTQLNGPAKRH